ncbi:Mitochondrial import inner membrane translocase subunit TIM22 [Orchesella cincta]|uniref:Mitochondrial import inner membrane translocase subunit TIM22 n=1 Tax=Orchesella cincta TaxID=48709 RepID=A0A1D2MUJ5_ORCCI|nr:Mitochondrial import inner membrane translocase subunit TIM22 [Orchesella cincta]
MKVAAESPLGPQPELAPLPPRFKTINRAKDDLKGLYKTPVELWDDNYVGEVLSESDDCHPENSSFVIGATGAVMTGLVTGFFSTRRVHTPINTPFSPTIFPKIHNLLSNSVILSSTAWRVTKRTLLGTILYAVLECDFKDFVAKKENKYQGSVVAGAVCGGVFGLRGGLRGAAIGMVLFSSLPAAIEAYNRSKLMITK